MAKAPLFNAALMPEDSKKIMYAEIEAWHAIATQLSALAELETELRVNLFNKYFAPNPSTEEGTNHIKLDYGKQLTADYRINRKVDEAQLDAALALGTVERTTVDELFAYKPSLRVGEWKDTDAETKLKFADIVTETPGTPGLKISAPKR